MKKAVIATGGTQYLVTEGESLKVELLKNAQKNITFEPLLIIDEEKISIGKPQLKDAKVAADIIEQEVKAEKVIAIRYEAKKRVNKRRGHRQRHTLIKISKIS